MNEFFFWLMAIISLLFFILIVAISICQWIIYFRVEKTILEEAKMSRLKKSYKEVEE